MKRSTFAILVGAAGALPLLHGAAVAQEDHAPAGMSYLDNGTIRLGVDLDLGGAITWLSESGSEKNVVNSADYGRQIQMSFYSGPVPYEPEGKKPAEVWRMLGWNPIQTGDVAGKPSRVIEHTNNGKELLVRCIPMHWPLDDEPAHCAFATRIQLAANTVHVRCFLRNERRDKTQYAARGQELPAVYTNGFLHRLVTYDGPRPFSGEDVRVIDKRWSSAKDLEEGNPWASWQATEGWAALLDDEGWGLGIVVDEPLQFGGGFFGTPGAGGPKDAPTGYMSPTRREILDANIEYEYDYHLVLGTLADVRRVARVFAESKGLPIHRFRSDRQHWTYFDCRDAGWPIEGELVVQLDGRDPQLIGPRCLFRADDVPRLFLEAAFATGEETATLFWTRHGEGGFTAENAHVFRVQADGEYHAHEVLLEGVPGWEGIITRLRLDPVGTGGEGRTLRLRSIAPHRPGAQGEHEERLRVKQ